MKYPFLTLTTGIWLLLAAPWMVVAHPETFTAMTAVMVAVAVAPLAVVLVLNWRGRR